MVMADTRKRPLWKPSAADFQRILGEQNPWLADGSVPDTLARKVERPLAMELWKRVLGSVREVILRPVSGSVG